jgi:hypothetical protein
MLQVSSDAADSQGARMTPTKPGDLLGKIKSDAEYAAYANHCAIQGVVPLTAKMWERDGRPHIPKPITLPQSKEEK